MSTLKANQISDTDGLVAIFGGTFDPVHLGHVGAIDLLNQTLGFESIHWVLSARPPHKNQVTATIEQRFEMLELAISNKPTYYADNTEIIRQEKSYTIDTVEVFRERYPNANLVVVIGSDSLLNLPSWHRYKELIEQVNWVVMHRPGYELALADELEARFVEDIEIFKKSSGGALWLYEHSEFEISSTQLRIELANKQTDEQSSLVKQFLASDVLNYIQTRQLYKITSMKSEQIKQEVVEAIENVKGQDISVIDIADISNFADYMVVVSGTSDTHVKALAREASDSLRTKGVIPINEDGADVGEWVLVDFGDVVLHVMRPEVREYYDLEKLWDEDVRMMVEKHRQNNEDE